MNEDLDIIDIDPADMQETGQVEEQPDTGAAPESQQDAGQALQKDTPAKPAQAQEKTFSQADVDAIVEKRLARERAASEKTAKANPILTRAERIAQQYGTTPEALFDSLEKQRIAQIAESEGISTEAATRLYHVEQKNKELEVEVSALRTDETEKQREATEFSDFLETYADVKAEEIPAEVWQMRKETGKPLVECYRAHENKTLRDRIAALEQQLKNTKTAPIKGGASAHGTGTVEPDDPFLRGMDLV